MRNWALLWYVVLSCGARKGSPVQTTALSHHGALRLDILRHLSERPEPFAPGAPRFWDDPHISASMLAAHLDSTNDAASRRPSVIDASVRWLLSALDLHPDHALLDLGCGPGLYSERFARAGLRVTGIDASQRSIAYARAHATERQLAIDYRHGDYLAMNFRHDFDAVVLIYGDLCALAPAQRDHLLAAISTALKADGRFALDVTTPRRHTATGDLNHWQAYDAGFWRPTPHLVLTQGFAYPDRAIFLEQYVVIDTDTTVTVYRNWFQDYTVATITEALERHGFAIDGVGSDLTGRPADPDAEWIGVVGHKR
jgi:SAM-dependent methyltransferase